MTSELKADDEPSAAPDPAAVRRFVMLTGLFLAGPVIWITHFMVVYLLAEWVCAPTTDTSFLSSTTVVVVTLITTVLAVAAIGAAGFIAYRRWSGLGVGDDDVGTRRGAMSQRELYLAGVLLSVLFVIAVLYVGVPAAVLDPC